MATTEASIVGLRARRQRLIDEGELVPNAPLRERLLWLLDHDPDFTLCTVCDRLVIEGFPTYMRSARDGRRRQDTSRLRRNLGMWAQTSSGRKKADYDYYTTHIPYELAVAICRALGMDPVDAGV